MSEHSEHGGEVKDRTWLDDPGNVDKLVYGLYGLCAILLVSDLLYEKHPHFAFEGWFGFFGFFGFLACSVVVFISKALRKVVIREEDYYDD